MRGWGSVVCVYIYIYMYRYINIHTHIYLHLCSLFFYCLPLPVFFLFCFGLAWCVLLIQNNKKLTKKQKGPCYRVLWYFLHIFIETLTGVWTDGLHPNCNIPVTNRQTERLYWRAVFIMKQYWDQIETVVTWWLIPPLRSPPPPPGPDTPLAQLIPPQKPSSGPVFSDCLQKLRLSSPPFLSSNESGPSVSHWEAGVRRAYMR